MVVLEKVKMKNFLSIGNCSQEVLLNDSPMTLIVGKNGAGKSTIIEAITFGLYGKSFRKINKPQLVNTVNNKECEIEVEFSVGKKKYSVLRGIKPNKLVIKEDGKEFDSLSSKDQQEFLENNILRINYKSFTQIVVLGSASFVPFMNLSASDRRDIIEDILDIKIFSVMKQILKGRRSSIKTEKENIEYKISVEKEKIELIKKNNEDLSKNIQETIQSYEKNIEGYRKKSLEYKKSLNEIDVVNTVDESKYEFKNKSKKKEVVEKLEKLKGLKYKLESKLDSHKEEHKFFENHDDCPTCKREIDEVLKGEKLEFNAEKITSIENGIEDLKKQMKKFRDKISEYEEEEESLKDELNKEKTKYRNYVSEKEKIEYQIEETEEYIEGLEKSIKDNKKKLKEVKEKKMVDDLDVVESSIRCLEKDLKDLKKKERHYTLANDLLSDGGMKTKIIRKYLPIINSKVNEFLKEMDFYTAFELDETFSETIRSRYRDEFSYTSFSEGEKKRIDVALLLTWRYIASIKNSAIINILFMDEIFDSSLDQTGIDDVMKLFNSLKDTNLFIISHRVDDLDEKFESKIIVNKKDNFTEINK